MIPRPDFRENGPEIGKVRQVLRLRGVGKRYGASVQVLRDIDLDLDRGDVVGVLGDNGSGKTTLMRILANVSTWDPGTIAGRPVTGYLPDRFPAGQRMTAIEYLVHMGRIRGLRTRTATARATELLDRLDLVPSHDTPMRMLSKGNAQKVGLVQALLPEPELLVLDEPWSGLDRDTQHTLGEIITELRAAGAGIVFTDHREAIVAAHATRSYHLADGSLNDRRPTWAGPMTRVQLERRPGAADAPWTTVRGVHVDRDDNTEVELTVLEVQRDELLLVVLRAGWSVREVAPR